MMMRAEPAPARTVTPATCDLFPDEVPPGRCPACLAELPKRRRRWCRPACADRFHRLHDWNAARSLALARDDHRCARCGAGDPWAQVTKWNELRRVLVPVSPMPNDPDGRRRWHAEWSELDDVIARYVRRHALEVNHIAPRRGQGYGFGCWNHPDNLETLCHGCHVLVTTAQRTGWDRSARHLPASPRPRGAPMMLRQNLVQPLDPQRDDGLTRQDVADRDDRTPPEPYWAWSRLDHGVTWEEA